MKAYLRSVRIAPKKASLVAKMVRGMPVPAAIDSLEHTNKKAARIIEGVIRSAAANARQNNDQNPDDLIVKTVVVNKAITYHRGIPMARGRMRRIRKFLSHIEVTLGYPEEKEAKQAKEANEAKEPKEAKVTKKSSKSSASSTSSKTKKTTSQKTTSKAKSTSSSKKTPKKTTQSKKPAGSAKKTASTSKSS